MNEKLLAMNWKGTVDTVDGIATYHSPAFKEISVELSTFTEANNLYKFILHCQEEAYDRGQREFKAMVATL